MRGTQILEAELKWINQSFHAIIDDMTDEEWTARPLPGMNLAGFTLWHIARTQDVDVQTAIRGVPEVITQPRWAACGTLATPGFGFTVTLEEADAIAHGIRPADVGAYADAVLAEIVAWLATLSDEDLDTAPDWRTHIAPFPVLQVPELLEMSETTIWEELLGTCGLHCRGHLAEVAIIKQQLRQRVTVPSASSPPVDTSASAGAEPALVAAVSIANQSARVKRHRWPWGRR